MRNFARNNKIVIVIVTLIAMLALIGAGLIYASNSANIDSLNLNVVASGTMEPILYRGDIVVVDKNPNNIQVGDIVIYNPTWFPNPVIHRVISIKNEPNGTVLYEMKGDNNFELDPELISSEQIISKVVKINNNYLVIPKVGYISLWFQGI
jgi:signal peptidase I